MGNAWKHFCTITHHKNLVLVGCFKIGLYKQGLPIVAASQSVKGKPEEREFLLNWVNVVDYE